MTEETNATNAQLTADQINEFVEGYLSSLGIKWEIRRVGDDCPPFCTDLGKPIVGRIVGSKAAYPRRNHIHGQHYQLYLERGTVDGETGCTLMDINGNSVGNFSVTRR